MKGLPSVYYLCGAIVNLCVKIQMIKIAINTMKCHSKY